MIHSIEQYLTELKKALSGSDPATIQDALYDAEEHLRTAVSVGASGSDATEAGALAQVIEKYGAPEEIAAAYRQIESLAPPALATRESADSPESPALPAREDRRPFYTRFFGVLAQPRAWGSLFYLLFAFITGIIYFTWAVTGLSTSLGLMILVIGLPVAGLFLLSVRGIALLEGRIVEALLGIRMPRRPRLSKKNAGVWGHFKNLIADKHTWFSLVYMILQMPLGTAYFTVFVSLISVSLGLMVWPIVSLVAEVPVIIIGMTEYYPTGWLIPISVITGILLLTITMHLVKATGKAHGYLAKSMLVRL